MQYAVTTCTVHTAQLIHTHIVHTSILYGLANINVNHNTENQQLKVDLAKVRQIICTAQGYTII